VDRSVFLWPWCSLLRQGHTAVLTAAAVLIVTILTPGQAANRSTVPYADMWTGGNEEVVSMTTEDTSQEGSPQDTSYS
jgi:hypothetical protein